MIIIRNSFYWWIWPICFIGFSALACDSTQDNKRERLLVNANQLLGSDYSIDLKKGFDCSGFVQYAYRSIGISIPRSSESQYDRARKVGRRNAEIGDIIVFKGSNERSTKAGHVGIIQYIVGDTLFFIHSSSSRGVIISNDQEEYYSSRFIDVVRFIDD